MINLMKDIDILHNNINEKILLKNEKININTIKYRSKNSIIVNNNIYNFNILFGVLDNKNINSVEYVISNITASYTILAEKHKYNNIDKYRWSIGTLPLLCINKDMIITINVKYNNLFFNDDITIIYGNVYEDYNDIISKCKFYSYKINKKQLNIISGYINII